MSVNREVICSLRSKQLSILCDHKELRLEDLGQGNKLIVWDTKGSLIVLHYYGYLHMIKFSEFNDLHDSYSVGIREQKVYTHMAIIIRKVYSDLLIRV